MAYVPWRQHDEGTFHLPAVMPDQGHKSETEKAQLEIEENICNQKMLLKLK